MMRPYLHGDDVVERWRKRSRLDQLANIGSEVHRMVLAGDNEEQKWKAFARAAELLVLSLEDKKWKGNYELARANELLSGVALEGKHMNTTLEDLDRYFFQYTMAFALERDRIRESAHVS